MWSTTNWRNERIIQQQIQEFAFNLIISLIRCTLHHSIQAK